MISIHFESSTTKWAWNGIYIIHFQYPDDIVAGEFLMQEGKLSEWLSIVDA